MKRARPGNRSVIAVDRDPRQQGLKPPPSPTGAKTERTGRKGRASQREFLTREAEFERQMMKFFITNIRKRKYA